jgi:hypothetical protein
MELLRSGGLVGGPETLTQELYLLMLRDKQLGSVTPFWLGTE